MGGPSLLPQSRQGKAGSAMRVGSELEASTIRFGIAVVARLGGRVGGGRRACWKSLETELEATTTRFGIAVVARSVAGNGHVFGRLI